MGDGLYFCLAGCDCGAELLSVVRGEKRHTMCGKLFSDGRLETKFGWCWRTVRPRSHSLVTHTLEPCTTWCRLKMCCSPVRKVIYSQVKRLLSILSQDTEGH